MKYEIWQDNGVSTIFESDSTNLNVVLDQFCKEAGYVDHADYCQAFDLSESPFNIRAAEKE